jgi:hypothetical protein
MLPRLRISHLFHHFLSMTFVCLLKIKELTSLYKRVKLFLRFFRVQK